MERGEDAVYRKARGLSCFRRTGDRDLRILLRHGRYIVYRRDRALCYQSEPAREVFLILAGSVVRQKYRADESCVLLWQMQKGDWVGLSEVLLSSSYLSDAIAEEKTEALAFSSKAFVEVMKIPSMKDYFLEYQAKSVFMLHSQIELNLPLARIIQHILAHAQRKGDGSGSLVTTQDDIAQAVGVTRETVNKYLQSLQAEGVLQIGRGRIGIPDCEALEDKTLI